VTLHSKRYLENSIKIMYAGRAAEELFFDDPNEVTNGASQDIKQATSILKEYLALYGMGGLGMIDLSQFRREPVDIIQEASALAKKLYDETVKLLRDNKLALESLASELLAKETLEEPEIDEVISKAAAIQLEQNKMGHIQ
jgi:cell division protease FtsH